VVPGRLFSALLKYWRGRRGLSQLDLALHAGVSARHLSFLESGRAAPSETMLLRLFGALDVPLRDQNDGLRAAGFLARFPEPELGALDPAIERAVTWMMDQHEPYPLTVISPAADVVRSNRAATAVFSAFIADPAALTAPMNMFSFIFDPSLMRPFIVDWDAVARQMIVRVHREALHKRATSSAALLERVLRYPGVPKEWRDHDFSLDVEPTFTIRLRRNDVAIGFFTAITSFSSPRQVLLDELRIESAFPIDQATVEFCASLARR
jgi:transcriptional regulator with XRE-family HTH domain